MQARWPRTLGEIVNGEPNEESSPKAIVKGEKSEVKEGRRELY